MIRSRDSVAFAARARFAIRAGSNAPSPSSQAQDIWWINPTSGNDANDGLTELTAIRTYAEYLRRTGMGSDRIIAVPIVVNIVGGDLPASDPLIPTGIVLSGGQLFIDFVPDTLRASTFTAVTAKNRATNQPQD